MENESNHGSNKTVLTIRLNDELKQRAEAKLNPLGLTPTDAVTQLYRFIAEHGRMPVTERPNPFNEPLPLPPLKGISETAYEFLAKLEQEHICCSSEADFINAVIDSVVDDHADLLEPNTRGDAFIFGANAVTFWDSTGTLKSNSAESLQKKERLTELLMMNKEFSRAQAKEFISAITDTPSPA